MSYSKKQKAETLRKFEKFVNNYHRQNGGSEYEYQDGSGRLGDMWSGITNIGSSFRRGWDKLRGKKDIDYSETSSDISDTSSDFDTSIDFDTSTETSDDVIEPSPDVIEPSPGVLEPSPVGLDSASESDTSDTSGDLDTSGETSDDVPGPVDSDIAFESDTSSNFDTSSDFDTSSMTPESSEWNDDDDDLKWSNNTSTSTGGSYSIPSKYYNKWSRRIGGR